MQELLRLLHPDFDALLREISAHISDNLLEEIALADYGEDMGEHMEGLRTIRDESKFVEPVGWCPCEVLELIRNSRPEDPAWKPGSPGERGHWMRAFACAALLRARLPPWNYSGDAAFPSKTLIQLIGSLRLLPVRFDREAASFLAWTLENPDLAGDHEQPLYCALGLLWFSLHLTNPPPDDLLVELIEWIVLRETQFAEALPGGFDWWLLGIHGAHPPPSPWSTLGSALVELDLRGHSVALQDWVRLIGAQLAG